MSWYVKKLMDNLPGITYTARTKIDASTWQQETIPKFINIPDLTRPAFAIDLKFTNTPWPDLYKCLGGKLTNGS